ncbi:MAG: hypothetical protein WCJ55_03495 [Chloroflexales bacterium]
MNTRTVRMFSATIMAIMLMFVGDVIWNVSGGADVADQPTYPILARHAVIIAQDTVPGAKIVGTPALSSYEGTAAYAVSLDAGTIYVEATTGRVLVNTVSTAMSGGPGGQGQ